MSITPETVFKSTLAKIVSAAIFIITSTWWLRGHFEDIKRGQENTDTRLSAIESFMKSEAVTQSQAERYAAAFRWENRGLDIAVPDPKRYQ